MTLDLVSAIGIIAGTFIMLLKGRMDYIVVWLLGAGSMLILTEALCRF